MKWTAIAAIAALITACTWGPSTGSEEASGNNDSAGDQVESDFPGVGGGAGETPGGGGSGGVAEDAAGAAADLTWCAPEAVPYDVSEVTQLPEGVVLDGFCEATTLTRDDAEATRRYQYDPELGVLEITANELSGPGNAFLRYTFDEEGRPVEVYLRGQEGWYSVGTGETWYELNAYGELDRKVAAQSLFFEGEEGQPDVIETVQTWEPIEGGEGQRLIAREVRAGEGGRVVRALSWEYDADGALVSARMDDTLQPEAPRAYKAVWSYDDNGFPAAVERTVDGVLVERETWTFDSAGTLLERTYESLSLDQLAAEHGGDRWSWQVGGGLDTFERRADDLYMDDPWRDALPVARGDCYIPPRGPGHGYPDGEPEYQLGVPRDERPQGIGFAYGNQSYGWLYGDVAWYGHDGLGSGWNGTPLSGDAVGAEVSVTYEDGRMVSEHTVLFPAPAGVPVSLERERVFESGRLVSDRLSPVDPDDPGPDRLLRFQRDEAGHLVQRELVRGDDVIARQSWVRDAGGRALEHAIEAEEARIGPLGELWESWFDGFGAGPVDSASWYWRYEGDLLVERGGGPTGLHESLTYDDSGRLVATDGTFEAFDNQGARRWTYDDAGRVVELCNSYDEVTWTCSSTVFDDAGRVAWREAWQGEGEPVVVELNEYTCSP